MSFVIKYPGAGYFVQMTAIGPMFGGTRKKAAKFETAQEAERLCASSWKFTMAKVVELSVSASLGQSDKP